MTKRAFHFLLIACLVAGPAWAASDPFLGNWKLNPSKSRLIDVMKVEAAGANRYALTFNPGFVEYVVADGSDHPVQFGTTFSITVEAPDTWKAVRKKQGRLMISAIWKLSPDGKTLTDNFTGYKPDGSTFHVDYVYRRTSGSSGFAATWESVTEQVDSTSELKIQPYQGSGLSFISPAQQSTKNVKFDGRNYRNVGPNVAQGLASSGHRGNEREVEITDKIEGKVIDTRRIELSPDLKILTMTVNPVGQSKPNVLVFDRE